jgi:hypothetical protein
MMKCLFQIVLDGSVFSIFSVMRETYKVSSVVKDAHPVKDN